MPLPIELEVSRLTNLTKGFGWEMSEQKLVDNEIIITLKKKVEIEPETVPE